MVCLRILPFFLKVDDAMANFVDANPTTVKAKKRKRGTRKIFIFFFFRIDFDLYILIYYLLRILTKMIEKQTFDWDLSL